MTGPLSLKIYLSIPIRNQEQSYSIENYFKNNDIEILNPCNIVSKGYSYENIPLSIANTCWQMIDVSSGVVLFGDYYGRDCAAEIGYAIAKKKPIFPVFFQSDLSAFDKDWMIKYFTEEVSFGLEMLVEKIQKKYSYLLNNQDQVVS